MSLFSFDLTLVDLVVLGLVAVFVGMAKTGVHGTGMMAVPLLASVFGGQKSSGIMLPILCLADIMGVIYYHRHASWQHLKKLFPWAVLGTALGTVVGSKIDDAMFKVIMACIILGSVVIMIWLERNREKIPDGKVFGAVAGTAGGFTSMVGNLAGSVMAVYLLSMRLPKNVYIGTTAWFFMVMNWIKVPFHVFAWHTITLNTFLLDLLTVPLIAGGAYLGIVIVRKLPENMYRWFIIGMTLLAAVMMLL